MKVTKTLILALTLAVPLSPISLVTADEPAFKDNIEAYSNGTPDHSLYTQKTVKILPLEFRDVVIVPPSLENISRIEADQAVAGIPVTNKLDTPGVAFILD